MDVEEGHGGGGLRAAENVMPRSMFPEISDKQRGPRMEKGSRYQGGRTSRIIGSK